MQYRRYKHPLSKQIRAPIGNRPFEANGPILENIIRRAE